MNALLSAADGDFVRIVEVGPRDGLQNEKTHVGTADKVALINRLSDTGLLSIEATSFVSPAWVPQLADAADVFAAIDRRPGIAYPVLVPNEKGYERARAVGVQEVAVFTAASEAFNRKNINVGIDESIERFRPVLERAAADGVKVRGYVSTVLGCPYQGDVPVADVVRVAKTLHAMGCYEISLGDTIGVGTPRKAPTARRWPTCWPAWRWACGWSIRRYPARAAVPMPRAPAATSPARTWCTCCTAWACGPAWTCLPLPRPAAGSPRGSAGRPAAASARRWPRHEHAQRA